MTSRLRAALKRFLTAQAPTQGMIEYALIIALVAIVAIAGIILLGPSITNLIGSITGGR